MHIRQYMVRDRSVFTSNNNMTVCLSGLPAPKEFDTVGEPATLQQR